MSALSPAARFAVSLVALTCLLRLPSLVLPIIDTDEAGHGVCARELLAGGRLYVDYADNKPPLLYWMYAGIMALGAGSVLAVHWFGLLWILAGAWGVATLLSRHGFSGSRWGALAYVVGSSVYLPNDMLATNGEQLMNPLAVFAVLAWFTPRAPLTTGIAAGALGLAAGLCYQKGWATLGVLGLWALVEALRPPRSGPLLRAAGLSLGVAGGLAVVGTVLIHQGILREALQWNFSSNLRYIQRGNPILSFSWEDGQPHGTVRVLFYLLANLLPMRVIWAGLRMRRPWAPTQEALTRFCLLWLAASFAALSLGGRYFGHYFLQTVPAWSLLFGATFPLVTSEMSPPRLRRVLWSGIPLAGLAVFSLVWVAAGGLESQHPLLHALARHASTHSRPHERIFVWGYASPVYYYARRQPGTRFVYPQSLAGYLPGVPHSLNQTTDPSPFVCWQHWDLALGDLEEKKPVLIYDLAPARFHYWGKFPVSRYPLSHVLQTSYAPFDTIAGAVAYRRCHGQPCREAPCP